MKKQSKSLGKHLKTSKGDQRKTITLNVAHILFLHGLIKSFPRADLKDNTMKQFLNELAFLLEIYIDGVDNDELKAKFNYKNFKNGVQKANA